MQPRAVRIYIAGPYTISDREINVNRALAAADRLLEMGYVPYVPHLSHYWDRVSPKPYEVWMNLDFAWLRACDCLLRLPGRSPGGEREVALARDLGLPVYFGLEAVPERAGTGGCNDRLFASSISTMGRLLRPAAPAAFLLQGKGRAAGPGHSGEERRAGHGRAPSARCEAGC